MYSTINIRFKPQGLINFMVHNHLGLNQERGQIETINLWNLFIWMGKLTRINLRPGQGHSVLKV